MEQAAHQNFTELEVWKKAREFKKEMEELAKTFPPEEKYRLADQLIRSARSINANIAEGHGRFGYPDQIKFCMNARGSLNETLNHLIDPYDCHFISKEQLSQFKEKFNAIMALLNGYIAYLRNLLHNKKAPLEKATKDESHS